MTAAKKSSSPKSRHVKSSKKTAKKTRSEAAKPGHVGKKLDGGRASRTDRRPGMALASRTAEQIAVSTAGPRPIPELTAARTAAHPDLLTETVSNGLRVIAVRKPGTPLVEVRLRVPFGGTAASHSARSELLAATLLLGTASRSREQVDAELAQVGGHLDASVDPQRFAVIGSVLSSGLPVLLHILAESLVEPALRRHDVLGERDRLVEHLAIAASQPAVVARHHLQERRFGTHPVTREMPDPAAVAVVSVAALRAMQRKSLVPDGSTLVLVGDLEPAQAIALVERALASWAPAGVARSLSTPPPIIGAPVRAYHRDGAVQSQVRLTAGALERTDPGLRGRSTRESRLRRLLLVTPGREHPRGQGLYLRRPLQLRVLARASGSDRQFRHHDTLDRGSVVGGQVRARAAGADRSDGQGGRLRSQLRAGHVGDVVGHPGGLRLDPVLARGAGLDVDWVQGASGPAGRGDDRRRGQGRGVVAGAGGVHRGRRRGSGSHRHVAGRRRRSGAGEHGIVGCGDAVRRNPRFSDRDAGALQGVRRPVRGSA